VACAFRHQDLFDNRHPLYAGDLGLGMRPALAQALQEADWLLALGTRLEEITTAGYALLDAPAPQPVLVHVHPDPDELGAVFQPELAIAAGMPQLCARLAMMAPIEDPPWQAHAQELCAGLARWRLRPAGLPASLDPDLWQIMADLRAALPPETIVCNGAGNFAGWLHRFFPFAQLGTQLAPASGSMGYAVPAAIAAKLNAPERPVICVSGDGDFLMSAQELATAVQLGAGVVFLVMDNGMYGSIRAHQEARHPGRVSATTLANPDFADFARSFGAHGATVRHSAEFPAALAEALASARARRRPALIHICCDPLQVSPTVRLAGVK
jgi:acetolactate synthase-1/2/3 large subunit